MGPRAGGRVPAAVGCRMLERPDLGQRGQTTWEGGHTADPLGREGASVSQADPTGERPNGHEKAGPLEEDREKELQTGRPWKPRRQTGGPGSNVGRATLSPSPTRPHAPSPEEVDCDTSLSSHQLRQPEPECWGSGVTGAENPAEVARGAVQEPSFLKQPHHRLELEQEHRLCQGGT